MQTKRGVALSDCRLCASPDAFHSTLKIRKREVVPVNQGFLCCVNFFAAARRRPNCAVRSGSSPYDGDHIGTALLLELLNRALADKF